MMAVTRHLLSVLLVVFTCSALENVELKAKKEDSKNGQKRLDIHVSKWREAQNAINSLIDESISNEVAKAKVEVKTLLERNIAKHLHEASRKVMQNRYQENDEIRPAEVTDHVHYDIQAPNVCHDKFDNCATLAASGVCDTSRVAMRKHCARTCELCDDKGEELPPASPVHEETGNSDTWTIIGANGERFTTSIKDVEQGTKKASITSVQVEKLLDYVKQNAPHLKLEKVKPGVLKLVRIPEKIRPSPHKITLKKPNDKPKTNKSETKNDIHNDDNYWTMKEDKEEKVKDTPKLKPKVKGPMIHFDLSSIAKNKGDLMEKDLHVSKVEPSHSNVVAVHHTTKSKSEEYLKHICHPMCKKTCISSCAPGCCAGEHHGNFPLYHRKSSHCHPFCKKHCISSCPLTCCAESEKVYKTWRHKHIHHLNPGCHPMCKKNCVPACPKACCNHEKPKRKSHCHPLCKNNCLSSCPLSCCNEQDRQKEKCHPLCRKTCLPSCPDECCGSKKTKHHKLIMKSSKKPNKKHKAKPKAVAVVKPRRTCPALCPDSCAPVCHTGCCNSKTLELSRGKPLIHSVPSGCTANCAYECLPGCPPACCTKTEPATAEVSRYTYPKPETDTSTTSIQATAPVMYTFPQPMAAPYIEQPQMYPHEQTQAMYTEDNQAATKNMQSPNTVSQSVSADAVSQNQADATRLYEPKHCPSACLTHCSPECVRSDCCDLD